MHTTKRTVAVVARYGTQVLLTRAAGSSAQIFPSTTARLSLVRASSSDPQIPIAEIGSAAALLFAVGFGVPEVGLAQTPLSLAEALRIAESRAPAFTASAAAARSARDMAVAAGQLPDPV